MHCHVPFRTRLQTPMARVRGSYSPVIKCGSWKTLWYQLNIYRLLQIHIVHKSHDLETSGVLVRDPASLLWWRWPLCSCRCKVRCHWSRSSKCSSRCCCYDSVSACCSSNNCNRGIESLNTLAMIGKVLDFAVDCCRYIIWFVVWEGLLWGKRSPHSLRLHSEEHSMREGFHLGCPEMRYTILYDRTE